jgi:transcriptional regulator with XRE-family HTH domain
MPIMSKQIGDVIKELRIERKMTQLELAQYAEVTLGTINKLENNKANVTLETLIKILDVVGHEISAKKKEISSKQVSS